MSFSLVRLRLCLPMQILFQLQKVNACSQNRRTHPTEEKSKKSPKNEVQEANLHLHEWLIKSVYWNTSFQRHKLRFQ